MSQTTSQYQGYRIDGKLYGLPPAQKDIKPGSKIERRVYTAEEYARLPAAQQQARVGALFSSPLGLCEVTAIDDLGVWGHMQPAGYSYP